MKQKRTRTIFDIEHDAVAVLIERLGISEALQFLHALGWGRGNYTLERREKNTGKTIEQIGAEARTLQLALLPELRRRGVKIIGEIPIKKRPGKNKAATSNHRAA